MVKNEKSSSNNHFQAEPGGREVGIMELNWTLRSSNQVKSEDEEMKIQILKYRKGIVKPEEEKESLEVHNGFCK